MPDDTAPDQGAQPGRTNHGIHISGGSVSGPIASGAHARAEISPPALAGRGRHTLIQVLEHILLDHAHLLDPGTERTVRRHIVEIMAELEREPADLGLIAALTRRLAAMLTEATLSMAQATALARLSDALSDIPTDPSPAWQPESASYLKQVAHVRSRPVSTWERRYRERLTAEAAARDQAMTSAGDTPLTIYVSGDDAAAAALERAVAQWLTAQDRQIVYRGDAVYGSLWRALVTGVKKRVDSTAIDAGFDLAGRASGLYGFDTRQAEVDKAQAEAFATVMQALQGVESAVIHHGTLLVVKHGPNVVRRELSQLEVAHLRRNPILTSSPATILAELQRLSDQSEEEPSPALPAVQIRSALEG
ncbi:hypothetical protein [Streptosporangium roseum]|uniref:hypothetical protein n=1 Tax=Streptosporangium roseum TaxID=2001 RepID=UPI00331B56AF